MHVLSWRPTFACACNNKASQILWTRPISIPLHDWWGSSRGVPGAGAWYYNDEEWTVDNQHCDDQYFDMPVLDDADCDPCGHHDVQKQFEDALRTAEELHEMTQDSDNMPNEDIDETKFADTTIEALELLYSQASHPVYPGVL